MNLSHCHFSIMHPHNVCHANELGTWAEKPASNLLIVGPAKPSYPFRLMVCSFCLIGRVLVVFFYKCTHAKYVTDFVNTVSMSQNMMKSHKVYTAVIEGKIKRGIEVTERRGRRCRKLLDDITKMRGCSHLKEEALERTMWRACFGRGFGSDVRHTTK
jgi:hypothetical protein